MHSTIIVLTSCFALLSSHALASGLYSKGSPVLQVDAKSYNKLIAKSNYTSIVEFYAPWCGHCKNLKPAYEKAASSLSGYAKVAAINCDDDSNKQFCGSMGVQGFPTLKLVKPSKKPGGKPLVEDYNGARTAKAISEVVTDKIPNHVARPKDADLDTWLKKTDRPKAVFFSEKGSVSPLVKALAIDFLGSIDVAQIKSTEKEAVGKFMVSSFPQVYIVPGVDHAPEKFEGELKKAALKEFLSKFATPNPEFPTFSGKDKPSNVKKDSKTKSKSAPKNKSEGEEASCPAGHKGKNPHTPPGSTTSNESNSSTDSPIAHSASESPTSSSAPPEPTPTLQSLDSEASLDKLCLNPKLGTCVLAVLPPSVAGDTSDLHGLSEISHKHALRRAKLFPIYSVPSTNAGGQALVAQLGVANAADGKPVVFAINPKKGWWAQYSGSNMGQEAIETWIDNIRFGDFKKEKLPEGIVKEVPASKAPKMEDADHDEL